MQGNHEQRRAARAIARKKDKARRRMIAKEIAQLPPDIQKLIRASGDVEAALRRHRESDAS